MESLNPTLTKFEISREIWKTLQSMTYPEMESFQLYHRPSEHNYLNLSYIDFEAQPITNAKAKRLIRLAVQKSLDKHGKVFLYYCPDNQEIAIEDMTDFDDDTLSLYDQISDNYYEGKD